MKRLDKEDRMPAHNRRFGDIGINFTSEKEDIQKLYEILDSQYV